jgi:hypothetical protein
MMLALTEEKFNEKLKEFNELEKNNSKNLEYLKDNWLIASKSGLDSNALAYL